MRPDASASAGQAHLWRPAQKPHLLRGRPGLAGETVFCSHVELEYLGCTFFLYKRMGLWHFRSLHSTWKLWNHRTFSVGFIWRKETTWFCLFSLFAVRLWED